MTSPEKSRDLLARWPECVGGANLKNADPAIRSRNSVRRSSYSTTTSDHCITWPHETHHMTVTWPTWGSTVSRELLLQCVRPVPRGGRTWGRWGGRNSSAASSSTYLSSACGGTLRCSGLGREGERGGWGRGERGRNKVWLLRGVIIGGAVLIWDNTCIYLLIVEAYMY